MDGIFSLIGVIHKHNRILQNQSKHDDSKNSKNIQRIIGQSQG
jgi:hypothetical protein